MKRTWQKPQLATETRLACLETFDAYAEFPEIGIQLELTITKPNQAPGLTYSPVRISVVLTEQKVSTLIEQLRHSLACLKQEERFRDELVGQPLLRVENAYPHGLFVGVGQPEPVVDHVDDPNGRGAEPDRLGEC